MKYDSLSKDELISKIEKLERDLIKANSNNQKLEKAEDTATKQSSILKFINSMAIPSADKSTVDEFSKSLLKAVKEYTGAALAVFNYYDSDKKELVLLHIEAEQGILKTILKIAGEKIVKTASPVDDEAYGLIIKNMVARCNTFTEVTFGAIPKLIDKALRTSTGIDRMYPIAHVIEGELYGTTMLAFKKGQASPSIELLESYAHLISVSLRRYNAEKALQESEIKHRKYVEHAPLGIFVVDDKGKYIDVNPGACELLGYSQDELLKLSIPDVLAHEKDLDSFQQLKEEGKLSYETNLKKKDGTVVRVRLDAVPLPNNQFIAFNTDITERKNAEESLKESEGKYRNLVETASDAIYVTTEDGTIVDINQRALDISGKTREELLGQSIESVDPNYPVNEFVKFWKDFPFNEQVIFESTHRRKNGDVFPVELSSRKFKLNNKIYLYGIARDITERKKAAAEINRMAEMLTLAPNAITVSDYNGNFIFANKKTLEIFGYTLEEFKAIPISELDTPETAAQAPARIKKIIKNGEARFEVEAIKKDGSIIPMEIYVKTTKWDNVDALITVATDITERKQAEIKLKIAKEKAEENEAKFRELFSSVTDAIFIYNPDTFEIIEANEATSALYGYSHKELIGMSCLKFSAEVEKSKSVAKLIKNRKKVYVKLRHHKKKDGTGIFIELGTYKISVNGKNIFYSVCHDITGIMKTEIELLKAKEKAEESDRLKSAFLTNMSHEIRTPMNGILGFTTLLKEPGLTGEEQQEFINIIEKSGNRMLNTINDIIDISKIEAGQVDVSISDINLNKQLDELFEFFLPEAKKKNIKLSIKKRVPNQLANFKSDTEKLNSILTNFIKNAIKYTHKGSIEFGYSINEKAKQSELEFYVKDTGIGISKERQNAVFNRFVQADIEDRQAYEGSGLGLAITKAYVEMLGGKIWVESEKGVGSTFYFTIPFNTSNKEIHKKKTEDSNIPRSVKKRLKVLIVEDDEFAISLLRIILKEHAKEMLIAKTGIEAVEMCRDNPELDIVLMDIKIPGIDGYEATRKIREFNKEVFIVAQTAYAQSGDREKSIQAGCNEYISKPIDKEKLLGIIANRF